jgi:hypothetical protein
MELKNKSTRTGCGCSPVLGCGCFILLFPICITFFGWMAFAFGPMSCALPSHCSQSEQTAKGIISLGFLFGGGFVLPTAVAIAVAKANKNKSSEK